jgi:hypothetical protein
MFHEFNLSFLKEAATLVDSKLQLLELGAEHSEDPDQLGIYDRAEYITGFGLVACQTYIATCVARKRLNKGYLVNIGPRHPCGQSIASLVNALANYWKHSAEWTTPLSKEAQRTVDTISALQVDFRASYVMANSLHALLRPNEPRIQQLIPLLKQWRLALQQHVA